ncbi:Cobalt transport protein ATP-binding subunit [Beggiatoa sp. PS]|nr:Cobalt transport protein ATP-binding subunit [Beggiatoa sp. PS]
MKTEKNEVLKFDQVSINYGSGIKALNNISLSFVEGESAVICGANGSGKTTLLKAAAGLLLPTEGRVFLANEELTKKTRNNAFKKIGFLFQDSEDQLFCPTVREDVEYGPINQGLSPEKIKQRVEYAFQLMGLEDLANRPIHHLSGGQKKRVALAGILAMQPSVLVLDEPTNGLDAQTSHELIKTLKHLNEDHSFTLIVVSHDMNSISQFAKRMIILKAGTIFKDGNIREVLTNIEALEEANIEPPIITRYFYLKNKLSQAENKILPLCIEEAISQNET